jgi:cell division protein FtsL
LYQYGNVATEYQKEKRKRPKKRELLHQPHSHSSHPQEPLQHERASNEQLISSGEKLLYIICVIGVVVLLSLLLTRYATISQLNFEAQYLQKELTTVNEENSNLQLIVAEYSSPERIITFAKEELGMTEKHPPVKILSNTTEVTDPKESTSNE